jgi:hypothetical protein
MDATSLAFRKDMLKWPLNKTSNHTPLIIGSSHKERVYFRDSSIRSLIRLFASKGITTAEYGNLLIQLSIIHQDIVSLLKTIEVSSNAVVSCPKAWSSFFLALASNTPVCGLVHPSDKAINLIESICTVGDFQKDISMMHTLQEEIPLLFKLFSDIEVVPPPLFSILRTMLKIAYQPFLNITAPDSNLENHYNTDDNKDISLSYFPSLPIIRQRGNYKNDLNRKQSICNKKGAGHPTLLPGIFTLFCSHGFCYGFEVMQIHESPNTPFSIMKMRFKNGMRQSILNASKICF